MPRRSIHIVTVLSCASVLVGLVAAQQPTPGPQAAPKKQYTTWRTMGGTADSANYSSLTQINRSNVDKLELAWTYDSGDQVAYVLAPIVVDRTLYGAAKSGSLVAIDAATIGRRRSRRRWWWRRAQRIPRLELLGKQRSI